MARRSCAIYATGIVSAHLLVVGIVLLVAQVFQTMVHSRLKKVRLLALILYLKRYGSSFVAPWLRGSMASLHITNT